MGAVFALLVPAAAGAAGEEPPLLPPLERPARLTSSFGEYRAGHYHGGLDFSTEGRVGLPVLAPGVGWVYRIRASGVGYGRSVYFRLDDGRTVVLAHLDRFADPVEDYTIRAQDREGRYEVDLYPPRDSLRFARGDLLAYTGETGAGPPHLHVEIRTGAGAEIAVNPLGLGWTVDDRVPPELTRLRVEPARAGVLVDGDWNPVVVPLAAGEPPRLTVTGPLRMWVETVDRALPGGNQLATYRLTASLESPPGMTPPETVPFRREVVLDAFDWRWPGEVEWTFHEPLVRTRGERWVALDPPPRTRQGVHRRLDGDDGTWPEPGGGSPPPGEPQAPGTHRLVLVAEDFAGNVTRREVELVVVDAAEPRAGAGRASTRSRGDYFEIVVPGAGGDVRVLESRARGGETEGEWTEGDWVVLSAPGGVVLSRRGPAAAGAWSFVARSGETVLAGATAFRAGGGDLQLRRDAFAARIPAEAVFGGLWITVEPTGGLADPGSLEPELEAVSAAYRMEPWATPLRERVRVSFQLPTNLDRTGVGIYSRSKNGWGFEGAEYEGGVLHTGIHNLEELALFRDTVPPSVSIPPFAVTGPRPRLGAVVADGGAGVVASTLDLRIDGAPVIAEWDPEAGRLEARLRGDLSPGEHVLEAFASDRAGNTASARAVFAVP